MDMILKDLRIPRPRGLKKEDKATLILDTMPRDQLLRFLAGPTREAPNRELQDPPVVEAPAPPAKRQRKVKEFFCDSASTETPETASVNSEDHSELSGETG